MPRHFLTSATLAAACLFASQGFAATYDVTARASASFTLNKGFLEDEVLVYTDPDTGEMFYDNVFLNGADFVTINGSLTAGASLNELFGVSAQTSSDPAINPALDELTVTYVVTNTHPDRIVQEMYFDITTQLQIDGGLSSELIGYTQIDGNAFVSGSELGNNLTSIFEEVDCTAAIAPCTLGASAGNFDFANGFFSLAAGESRTFSYTLSASTTVILPDPPMSPVPLPASGLLLGAGVMAFGLRRRRPAT